MSLVNVSQSDQGSAISAAAQKYGIPEAILWGVYGKETGFGSNVTTSSGGAVGAFQFTAANKGTGVTYPMTNTVTPQIFQQQADAAAAYLAALYKQHSGDWNSALQAYSGGGYGLSDVVAELSKKFNTTGLPSNVDLSGVPGLGGVQAVGGIAGVAGLSLPNPLKGIDAIAALLTSLDFWKRLGEVIAGIILVAMGLRSLTGGSVDPIEAAAGVARKVVR